MTPKLIFIVDDEAANRELLEDLLEYFGHESESFADGTEVLARLLANDGKPAPDLILMDVLMPKFSGYEVTQQIRREPGVSDLPIIMVTALTSREDRLLAVEAGANDFISKPIDRVELQVRITSLLKMKEAQDAIKRHRAELEDTVQHRTLALQRALEEVTVAQHDAHDAHLDTVYRLSVASEYKDRATAYHVKRVSSYCGIMARHMGLSDEEQELVQAASPMHDVGKLGIPDAILLKPGSLSTEERQLMQQHTMIGERILTQSCSELIRAGELIASSHHEQWDGSGYPRGISGNDIPIWGRICAVADVFDALTQKRPYKEAIPVDQSIDIMRESRGKHFDPDILDLFVEIKDEVTGVYDTYGNAHQYSLTESGEEKHVHYTM